MEKNTRHQQFLLSAISSVFLCPRLGGLGGCIYTIVAVAAGSSLTVTIGSIGLPSAGSTGGGYNGGGSGATTYGAGGGGATSLASANRLLVVAGGKTKCI
jgi:Glycine rich protein